MHVRITHGRYRLPGRRLTGLLVLVLLCVCVCNCNCF
jgi:hypothetical protein